MKLRRLHSKSFLQKLYLAQSEKSMRLRILFGIAGLIFITALPIQANPPVESCVSCEIPGVTPVTYITGSHAVIYAGRLYDTAQCKTYFLYCAVNDGGTGGHDISHTNFGDANCNNTCLESSVSPLGTWSLDPDNNVIFDEACGTVEQGTDPTTGVCGVKHDEESEGACYENVTCNGSTFRVSHLYIVVEGNVTEGTVTLAFKFGNASESIVVPGPGNCEDQGCAETNPTLPVKLINFEAHKNGETSILKWTTASESNNDYFEIEKADHTKNFKAIGMVQGSGNSNVVRSYTFTDTYLFPGVNFYRLKQVDFDGHTVLSPIRIVNSATLLEVSIYPNPTTEELFINFNDWDAQLETTITVRDLNGAEVLSQSVNSVTTRLSVSRLPIGSYFIQVTDGTTTQVFRFIKT